MSTMRVSSGNSAPIPHQHNYAPLHEFGLKQTTPEYSILQHGGRPSTKRIFSGQFVGQLADPVLRSVVLSKWRISAAL